MLDVYKNITTVRLCNELGNKCEENGAGESIEVASPVVTKLGVYYVTVIYLECVINFVYYW